MGSPATRRLIISVNWRPFWPRSDVGWVEERREAFAGSNQSLARVIQIKKPSGGKPAAKVSEGQENQFMRPIRSAPVVDIRCSFVP